MNWFERHLNWSLFLAVVLLPFLVGLIWIVVYFMIFGGLMAGMMIGGVVSPESLETLFGTLLPVAIISILVSIGFIIFEIIATLWYLGRKGRSKGFIILLIGPWIFSFILSIFNVGYIGGILGLICWIVGLIILLLLENRAV